ncbi:MAG: flagellar basal body L-ring protein FlgH [Gammaproteobacteria bacterium]|jgi:flagellar L-ring protein precursor FlgH
MLAGGKMAYGFAILIVASLYLGGSDEASAGSLYVEDEYESLVSDRRSYRVGDILTVMIYESATSSTESKSETDKSTSVGAKATDGTTDFNGSIGMTSGFEGGGSSTQTGKLVASVSVKILEKHKNGDMLVKGEQTLEFNNDMQNISVAGVVREEDISTNNTVLSTRLADAEIKFVGEGLIASRSKPGVLTRIWNWLF